MEITQKSILMLMFRIVDHASASSDIIRKHNNNLFLSDSDKQTLKVLAQLLITYKLKQQHAEK
ncbi:hypothetical protein CHU_2950 [Cytophaga hutchinsonii ATCC 33406]|uniref:Uncharacterized protein n=1 Tax=Cytophaga hutchinsonii (strain ATCC 33406 / DSM 1761 / CIP 103989 / NBRC 15051 / NCIMB 9469 / D465) TaxID=269798 RepID=A0A6N4SUM4_CYTH3|nr:hypothetical protein CHU_2950 [Cytophaga hutchinsonii ATCC 33406]SFX22285.1 hypothetical protein SAMN04487930_102111 [Cytophaga hutchinsonii ATCC 33406]